LDKEKHMMNDTNIQPGTKRFPQMAKRFPQMAKGIEEFSSWVDETMTAYSSAGAYGNYQIQLAGGVSDKSSAGGVSDKSSAGGVSDKSSVFVQGAIAIRVLPGGELNLLTDAGRWFLFAPGTWKSVSPEQSLPGECKFCGHRPKAANAAQ
jgi:hypothetical protein